jgi:phosphoribosylaminoimidazolecarboxamide formyltransferase/IMP cyclohydrolase
MSNRIRRALVSVFEKEDVVELGKTLASLEIEILSSGGTARLLEDHGISVVRVSDYTGFPEMLDGRVKTLHPRIHAGILAVRSNPGHVAEIEQAGIDPIDLVVVNLYPFEKTAATEGIALRDAVEMIDIGGPTLVRSAAKNYAHVGVVVDPADYPAVGEELRQGGTLSPESRLRLAVKAFRHTSAYDSAVQAYLSRLEPDGQLRPADLSMSDRLQVDFVKVQDLRYGENPHQHAAFYRDPLCKGPSICRARQLQGKELSFNNILDFDAALGLAVELGQGACAVIKHGNPCGVALGPEPMVAFQRALECDPLSAFGGVIAFNRKLDRRAAQAVTEHFFEGVVAPEFDEEALQVFSRKKKLRLLEVGNLSDFAHSGFDLRRVRGGMLAQEWDQITEQVRSSRVATRRQPSEDEWKALGFAWTVAKNVKSNAIVYAFSDRTAGIGAGQMSRVDSAKFGIQKAQVPLEGCVMASDAFFPFRDGLDVAAEAGVAAVIQPGGSIRDEEVVAAADEHEMAMVFTGHRHFRH